MARGSNQPVNKGMSTNKNKQQATSKGNQEKTSQASRDSEETPHGDSHKDLEADHQYAKVVGPSNTTRRTPTKPVTTIFNHFGVLRDDKDTVDLTESEFDDDDDADDDEKGHPGESSKGTKRKHSPGRKQELDTAITDLVDKIEGFKRVHDPKDNTKSAIKEQIATVMALGNKLRRRWKHARAEQEEYNNKKLNDELDEYRNILAESIRELDECNEKMSDTTKHM